MTIGLDGNEANVKNRVGSGQYAFSMLQEFARVKNKNFVVYLKEKPVPDLPKESVNFKYKVFGPKKLWTQFALPIKLTIGNKPDIFFTLGHYGPRFSATPYAVTIFDLSYLYYPELFNKDDLYQLTSWSKYSINSAKHIFAISQSTKEDVVKKYKIDPTKITVTYMGFNRKLFKPQPESAITQAKAKYKIKGEYIIFVGTLQPRKNIERLVEAFSQIKGDTKLVIVGKKGWMYDHIFSKVKKLNLESRVIFTDFVPETDLPALISGAKLYTLPSLYEGFGIPVIEAQSCGTPVVVSNTSSLPEVVGESGIKVDPNSTISIKQGIEKVLTSPTLASELRQKGFKNALKFSWQKCATETLKVLESLNP